jgi:hypothetical protein
MCANGAKGWHSLVGLMFRLSTEVAEELVPEKGPAGFID